MSESLPDSIVETALTVEPGTDVDIDSSGEEWTRPLTVATSPDAVAWDVPQGEDWRTRGLTLIGDQGATYVVDVVEGLPLRLYQSDADGHPRGDPEWLTTFRTVEDALDGGAPIVEIPGVSASVASRLRDAGFETAGDVASADQADLEAASYVGEARAERIHGHARRAVPEDVLEAGDDEPDEDEDEDGDAADGEPGPEEADDPTEISGETLDVVREAASDAHPDAGASDEQSTDAGDGDADDPDRSAVIRAANHNETLGEVADELEMSIAEARGECFNANVYDQVRDVSQGYRGGMDR